MNNLLTKAPWTDAPGSTAGAGPGHDEQSRPRASGYQATCWGRGLSNNRTAGGDNGGRGGRSYRHPPFRWGAVVERQIL
jgi:hypothetical protein